MRWFDKGEIKGKDALEPEQLDYLLQPSLTSWGPFNWLFRKHFDYMLAFLFLMVAEALLTAPDDIGLLSSLYLLVNIFLQGWLIYFFIKHGRRLSWNRSQWENFDAFQKSETKWLNFTAASFGMLVFTLYKGLQEFDSETIIGGSVVVVYFGLATLFPFFQAWRMKRRDPPMPAEQPVTSSPDTLKL